MIRAVETVKLVTNRTVAVEAMGARVPFTLHVGGAGGAGVSHGSWHLEVTGRSWKRVLEILTCETNCGNFLLYSTALELLRF